MNTLSITGSRKIVLGLGNLFYRDKGLGIHAMMMLRARLERRARVEWVDGGMRAIHLLSLLEGCSHLMVLTAINATEIPGTLMERSRDEILHYPFKIWDIPNDFQDVLGLAAAHAHLPAHLHLLGIQPGDFTYGVHLSPAVIFALPVLLERATGVLEEWGLLESLTLARKWARIRTQGVDLAHGIRASDCHAVRDPS